MQDRFEGLFDVRDHRYRIAIEAKGSNTFGIELIDEDSMNRWASDFTAAYIKNITRKVGSEKRITIFWKMLQTMISGNSNEVSFDILTSNDVIKMQKRSNPSKRIDNEEHPDNKRYMIVTQTTEFEQIKYPLLLQYTPFTSDEFSEIIKELKKENAALMKQTGKKKIAELEAQIIDLNRAYTEMLEEKDAEIAELKEKLIDSIKVSTPTNRASKTAPSRRSAHKTTMNSYERAPSVASSGSRRSRSSQKSCGSSRSSGSRGSQGRRTQRSPSYSRSPKVTQRSTELETDKKRMKLNRYIAQKYRQ